MKNSVFCLHFFKIFIICIQSIQCKYKVYKVSDYEYKFRYLFYKMQEHKNI